MKSVRSLLVRIYVEVFNEEEFRKALVAYTGHNRIAVSVVDSTYINGGFISPLKIIELINDTPSDKLEIVRGHGIALAETLRKACNQGRVAVQCFEGGRTWQVDNENIK